MKTITWIVSIAALLYAGACAFLYSAQRSLLYFPTPEATAYAAAARVVLDSGGEHICIWRVGDENAGAQNAIIYFGGNAEDVAQNIPLFKEIFTHVPVYLVNYRGYGGSTGSPSEQALFADALAVFDYVHTKHRNVSVIGRSLGSGVAVYLAAMRDIGRMVLVTPYDSIENIAKGAYPWFPVGMLLKDKFASSARIGGIKIPVLFVLADRDEVVPRANSDALIALLPARQAKVVVIPDTTHNNIESSQNFAESLRSFL
jgi:pimeloyl-ACP methyl ester carboxylesterase